MPWYCWIFTLILLILLNRLMLLLFWPKPGDDCSMGTEPVVLEDNSPFSENVGTTGIVPGGVSYIQTAHAGGVAVTKGQLGFQLGRKKGRNVRRG